MNVYVCVCVCFRRVLSRIVCVSTICKPRLPNTPWLQPLAALHTFQVTVVLGVLSFCNVIEKPFAGSCMSDLSTQCDCLQNDNSLGFLARQDPLCSHPNAGILCQHFLLATTIVLESTPTQSW